MLHDCSGCDPILQFNMLSHSLILRIKEISSRSSLAQPPGPAQVQTEKDLPPHVAPTPRSGNTPGKSEANSDGGDEGTESAGEGVAKPEANGDRSEEGAVEGAEANVEGDKSSEAAKR